MVRTRVPVLLVLLLATACGDDDGPGGDGVEQACTVGVTGAAPGTPACRATSLIHRADGNATTFTLETAAGESLTVLVGAKLVGPPTTSSYVGPSETVTCGVSVRQGARAWFSEYENASTGESLRGSCTLSFSRVEPSASAGGTATYRYTGSLTAQLHALTRTGSSGTVEVQATFAY